MTSGLWVNFRIGISFFRYVKVVFGIFLQSRKCRKQWEVHYFLGVLYRCLFCKQHCIPWKDDL